MALYLRRRWKHYAFIGPTQFLHLILNSNDECQFSLIEQIKQDYVPAEPKTVKARLVEENGECIMLSTNKKKKTVICFKNIGENIGYWKKHGISKSVSLKQKRGFVLEAAAKIICDDILSQVYDVKEYIRVQRPKKQ